jgi:hypothetical protein
MPPRRERSVNVKLPPLVSMDDASSAVAAVAAAVANGELGTTEAGDLVKIIEGFVRAAEATDLQSRLLALEARFK